MSEAPQDIPYLKFSASELVTTTVSPATNGMWATYDVVNIGTAPTGHDDEVFAAVSFSGTQVAGASHHFDNPVLAANGGSHHGTIHFDAHYFQFEGDWELYIGVPAKGIGQGFIDETRLPFKVEITPHS